MTNYDAGARNSAPRALSEAVDRRAGATVGVGGSLCDGSDDLVRCYFRPIILPTLNIERGLCYHTNPNEGTSTLHYDENAVSPFSSARKGGHTHGIHTSFRLLATLCGTLDSPAESDSTVRASYRLLPFVTLHTRLMLEGIIAR